MTGLSIPPGSLGPWSGGDVTPVARCLLAPNAGPMTLDGTNTWLVAQAGGSDALVIDPGPDDDSHLNAIVREVHARDLVVASIVLTHGHADHSEGAAALAEKLGCGVRAIDARHRLGSNALVAGDVLAIDGVECHVVSTPGHTSDSISLVLRSASGSALLTGDTVLGRGTTVVAHPDGRLGDYLDSLQVLRRAALEVSAAWVLPGHGPALTDPCDVIDYYLAHRSSRLDQVAQAWAEVTSGEPLDESDVEWRVVEAVYADVSRTLWPAALLSVKAQIEYLREQGDL